MQFKFFFQVYTIYSIPNVNLQFVRIVLLYGAPLEKTMARIIYWKLETQKRAVTSWHA